jgi:hypothetical protein
MKSGSQMIKNLPCKWGFKSHSWHFMIVTKVNNGDMGRKNDIYTHNVDNM